MFPYQQTQFQQQMMANLPFTSTSSTSQGYQAPPNYLSQLGGLGLTAASIYGLAKAEGGVIKGYAEGGIAEGLSPSGYSDTPMPMGQIAGAGLAELMQARQNSPMSAGMGPAFGGSNEDYVNSLYQNMLGRQADQGGYQHNLDLLNSGQINQQDLEGAFRTSAEGQRMYPRGPQGMGMASGLADIRLNQLLG